MRVVILCGGSGSRLWPESRESLPKQFIPIVEEKSLLDLTIERTLDLINNTKPILICNKNHGFLVKATLKKYKVDADLLYEPNGKNTCAAIYFAAKHCSNNENLIIMPSDHLITDSKTFVENISIIENKISEKNWIILGVKPNKASDAYGYIQVEETDKKLKKVINFIEKPSQQIASKLIKKENYYWNAGIFIAKSSAIINSVKKHAPKISKFCDLAFTDIKKNNQTNEFYFSSNSFDKIPSKSIDYAVMEYEENLFLHPFEGNWSDVGSWDSVAEIHKDKVIKNKVIQIDSNNNFIKSDKRIIATIGINDLIIIDSDNATLISKKNHSEKVKKVVKELIKKKCSEGLEHSFENRPWGKFEILLDDKNCKVKKIIVLPNNRLSLQYHNFRSEHWLIVKGKANVHLDGKNLVLKEGQSIDIPRKSCHYVSNKGKQNLIIIETQLGSYFGEDDIIRLDDPHNR